MGEEPTRRGVLAAGALLAAGFLTSCTSGPGGGTGATAPSVPAPSGPAPSGPAPSGAASGLAPEDVVTGLSAPWDLVFLDGSALVSERDSGRIVEIVREGDGPARIRAVGTVPGVTHVGEGGLLGLAVGAGRMLYAFSTAKDGNRLQRFPLTGAAGSFGLGRAETILSGIPAARFHHGGRIAFGPDGMLYAGVGDAQEPDKAQDVRSVQGKILRLAPDGTVPADNPFPGSLTYSYGHRNVQGLAWTPDGRLFASELGQNTWDELNEIVPGGNYGWPLAEGIAHRSGLRDPVQQWVPSEASPSGLAFLDGVFYLANLKGQSLRRVPLVDPGRSEVLLRGDLGRLRTVVPAPDGSLWILTNNTDGRGSPRAGDDRVVRLPLR